MIDDTTQQKVYDKLRSFDGMELAGHEPVNTSIASVLSEGEVLADTGEQYESIQDAVDASEGWTFVGPGKFYENVTIYTDDFTLKGAGYDTLIDGGDVGTSVTINGSGCTVSNIRAGSASVTIGIYGSSATVINNYCTTTVRARSTNAVISQNTVANGSGSGITVVGYEGDSNSIITGNTINNMSAHGVFIDDITDNIIVSNNTITNNGTDTQGGVHCQSFDNVIGGNRIHNTEHRGIELPTNSADNIVFNNRVSGSTNADINDGGTGNLLDANLTGSAN